MIRARENTVAWRAGAMSVLVHGLLFALFLFSVNWKSTPPMSVAEVELWDNLPVTPPVKQPPPVPQPPKPEPTPEPPKPQPKPEPDPEPKAEIQLKQEKPKPEVKKPPEKPIEKPKEPPKPDPAIKAKELEKKRQEDLLKKFQQETLAEDAKAQQHSNQKQEAVAGSKNSQASAGEIAKAISKISSKIRSKVIEGLCGTGNPELTFAIKLDVTGYLTVPPELQKGSKMDACDRAVEAAIIESQPLPLPQQPELLSQFRNLKLIFRPNDSN